MSVLAAVLETAAHCREVKLFFCVRVCVCVCVCACARVCVWGGVGFPALEEALHSPHGTEICSRNHSAEESTGTIHRPLNTMLYT